MNNQSTIHKNGNLANSNVNKRQKPKPKRGLVRRFFTSLFVFFVVIMGAGLLFVVGYSYFNPGSNAVRAVARAIDSNLKDGPNFGDLFSRVKERTNFVILGCDEDGNAASRTDFIMVGCYNSKTGEISLMSIPRDTYVIMPKERREILKDKGMWVPSDGAMKINAVTHYAYKEYGIPFLVKQLEDMIGVEIEYYARIDLNAFKYLVDEIDGVEFDVPQRMYYTDPGQDLYIDLMPGLQLLDGEQAEGVIRYRKEDEWNPLSKGYAEGDLGRVKTQQAFMKALLTQVLSSDKILNNADAMAKTFVKYVDTNFPITDAPKYLSQLENISAGNIVTYVMPGEAKYFDGQWYFVEDGEALQETADKIFYASHNQEGIDPIPSKGKNIKVLNGGFTSGLAKKTQDSLADQGYTVASIGDYNGTKSEYTRIMVREKGMGLDLQQLFSGSKVILDENMETDYDIIIVLGKKEK